MGSDVKEMLEWGFRGNKKREFKEMNCPSCISDYVIKNGVVV